MQVPRLSHNSIMPAVLAAAIKNVGNVPVSTVGRTNDRYVPADILAKGEADLVGLGRTLMCDPEFVKKTMESRTKEIQRCIACCSCFDQIRQRLLSVLGDETTRLQCALNREMGR